jgi:iron complex transport system substrate-binding protein
MKSLICFFLCFSWVMPVMAQEVRGGQGGRIISLGPTITENIYLLGAEERLVANTVYCVRPAAALFKEKIGSVMQVNIEKIVSLRPDLILATGLTQPQQIDKLRDLGFKVVRFGQPSSFGEICTQFVELGHVLGMEAQALQIVAAAKIRVASTQRQVAHLLPQKVFLQVGTQPLFSAVDSSFTHDFIELGGGLNIARGQRRGIIKYEKVIAENPAVIIIAIMGSESGIGARERQRWLDTRVGDAARDRRVHVMDPDVVCSPSPATFAVTLEVMARLIHPEMAGGAGQEVLP